LEIHQNAEVKMGCVQCFMLILMVWAPKRLVYSASGMSLLYCSVLP